MHVAEQPREIEECVHETGRRPVELLSEKQLLDERFVAVHATHVLEHEALLLGEAGAFACICATTERDLGDGLPPISWLRSAGVGLCVGVDSHVLTDPFEEMRALEGLERLRLGRRVSFTPAGGVSPAAQLWWEASAVGAQACGFFDELPTLRVDAHSDALALVDDEVLLDALVFGATPQVVANVGLVS
jgi:cytosine/adenosine deaminase-related metal-dependent hydrolase